MHGSINWEKIEDQFYSSNRKDIEKPMIIIPGDGKFENSYNSPYLDMIGKFREGLRESELLIIAGYSFSDIHINNIIIEASQRNQNLSVLICIRSSDNDLKCHNELNKADLQIEAFTEEILEKIEPIKAIKDKCLALTHKNIFEYFAKDLFLGVINKINAYNCFVKIPKPSLLKSFYINGNDYCGGIVGRYVIVYSENLGFLGIIQEISIPKESKYSIDDAESQDDYETFKTDCRIQLLLSFDYHEIENNAICYHSGIKEFPIVSSKVYICHNDLLNKILCGINSKNDKTSIKLGEVVGNKIPFSISIKDLHSYNQLSDKKMNVILFDATGEFENIKGNGIKKYTFGNSTSVKSDDVSSVYFSYKNFSTSDWFSLFQPSANVQATKLREAIKSLKLQKSSTSTTSLKKSGSSITAFNTNIGKHSASVFDITLLSEQITNECIYSNDKYDTDKFR